MDHMARVAELLDSWAEAQGLAAQERERWRAAGYLHDSLRDATPESLRAQLRGETSDWPDSVLHGPVAAQRLRDAGVADELLLTAIAYHTVGDASFGPLGRALYAADFLEPGRTFLAEERAALRARTPGALDEVALEVARLRITQLVSRRAPLHPRTVALWNALVASAHE
jgi:2-amino-4-hydroxy-6-hydroxymethyldihydropteridine diphosphokinase